MASCVDRGKNSCRPALWHAFHRALACPFNGGYHHAVCVLFTNRIVAEDGSRCGSVPEKEGCFCQGYPFVGWWLLSWRRTSKGQDAASQAFGVLRDHSSGEVPKDRVP